MNIEQQKLESQIRAAIGPAPSADFEAWQSINGKAIGAMGQDPVVVRKTQADSGRYQLRRSLMAMTALVLIVVTAWALVPREQAFANSNFAKTIHGITKAKTMSWVRTSYLRITNKEGKQWLQSQKQKTKYMEPGFRRTDSYDEKGDLESISISDPVRRQRLTLYLKRKQFEIKDHPEYKTKPDAKNKSEVKEVVKGEKKLNIGPFAWFNRAIKAGGEIIGQRDVDGRTVNVLRWRNKAMGIHNPKNVSDVWIDVETDQVIGVSHPGSSVFDPEKLSYRDNHPGDNVHEGRILGSITKDIVLDPEVDPTIFKFEIPDGFTKMPKQESVTVTETELVEWMEILAKINDNQFTDSLIIRNTKKIAESQQQEEPSGLEKQRRKIWYKHMLNQNTMPLVDFLQANTVETDYRYFGKGVKLGSKDKVVLVYRLKATGKFRAVYGDLRIKDISDSQVKELKDAVRDAQPQ